MTVEPVAPSMFTSLMRLLPLALFFWPRYETYDQVMEALPKLPRPVLITFMRGGPGQSVERLAAARRASDPTEDATQVTGRRWHFGGRGCRVEGSVPFRLVFRDGDRFREGATGSSVDRILRRHSGVAGSFYVHSAAHPTRVFSPRSHSLLA